MRFYQSVEAQRRRFIIERFGRVIINHAHNNQHAIRPERRAFRDLNGIEEEVFAEQGQVRDASDSFEYLIAALKPRTVGQHGEASRPAPL